MVGATTGGARAGGGLDSREDVRRFRRGKKRTAGHKAASWRNFVESVLRRLTSKNVGNGLVQTG